MKGEFNYLDNKERGKVEIGSKVHNKPLHLILITLSIFFSHRVTFPLIPKHCSNRATSNRLHRALYQLIVQPRPSTPLSNLGPTHGTRDKAHQPTSSTGFDNLVRKCHSGPNATCLAHIDVRMQWLTRLLPLQARAQPENPRAGPALLWDITVPFPPENPSSSCHVALSCQNKYVPRNCP